MDVRTLRANHLADLFTPRQLVALTTFSDLVGEAIERVRRDGVAADLPDDGQPLRDGGTGAAAYAEAVGLYLAFAVDKGANYWSSLCAWHQTRPGIVSTFGRQALPMVWDYAEANPIGSSSGNVLLGVDQAARLVASLGEGNDCGYAVQADAAVQVASTRKVVSTDPPYYDNIGYADLSDFFYVWLRRSLRPLFPDLFSTMTVPKSEELIASPFRHGGKKHAEKFFLNGMTQAMKRLGEQAHPGSPVTIYYAFKQSETKGEAGTVSTGWATFLDAAIRSGLAITGTWPMRTELTGNLKKNVAALASSIVLVCRPRPVDAPLATRREFLAALRSELPAALRLLQTGSVAPVDLAQAAIGPGMAIYTRYAKVLHAGGEPMTVRDALALINEVLDEILEEQEGDLDAESRWALAWFDEHGFDQGQFGRAELLAKAKNTSVEGMKEAGIVGTSGGHVWLRRPSRTADGLEAADGHLSVLRTDWDPLADPRPTVWKAVHYLVRAHETDGEPAAAELLRRLGSGMAETARDLCYRLYVLCERKKRATEARAYNGLVRSWPEIKRLASQTEPQQTYLDAS